eukprot:Gb_30339 [translate_table: standard]
MKTIMEGLCSLRWCFSLLVLCLWICPSSADLRLPNSARFPQAQAERFIKELNLLPGVAEAEVDSNDGPRLVERKINLDIKGDAGSTASLEELGHHAGYFRLEHTHAANGLRLLLFVMGSITCHFPKVSSRGLHSFTNGHGVNSRGVIPFVPYKRFNWGRTFPFAGWLRLRSLCLWVHLEYPEPTGCLHLRMGKLRPQLRGEVGLPWMFYFFFESRGSKADDPVVLWMTGGPGCSSELAVFYENGPFKISDDLTLVWNDYGWDKSDKEDSQSDMVCDLKDTLWRMMVEHAILARSNGRNSIESITLHLDLIRYGEVGLPEVCTLIESDYKILIAGHCDCLMMPERGHWVSNLIFVDQPTGTGFSYSTDLRDIRHDENGISNDMYDFLQAFFKEHPKYASNEFYITGESYAGHYIPAVTSRVHQGNKGSEGLPINLKGFAIGNGLTDPATQYKAYTDYALEMGLIGEDDYKRISKIYPTCELSIKLCGTKGIVTCFASYLVCNSIFSSILALAGNVNYYDVRKECIGGLCYDFSNMEKYLNQRSVRDVLGVGDRKFVSCSPLVYEAMLTDWMRNMEVGIPTLIEDGIKLLVYAGEYDLICNWLGNSRWVNSMEWSGHQNFTTAPTKPFLVDDEEAGLITSYGPLSFLKVHDAGHMVPMDQPKAALEMLKRWTKGSIIGENFGIVKTVTKSTEKNYLS